MVGMRPLFKLQQWNLLSMLVGRLTRQCRLLGFAEPERALSLQRYPLGRSWKPKMCSMLIIMHVLVQSMAFCVRKDRCFHCCMFPLREHVSGYAEPSDACPNAIDHGAGTQHVREHNSKPIAFNQTHRFHLVQFDTFDDSTDSMVCNHSKLLHACHLLTN